MPCQQAGAHKVGTTLPVIGCYYWRVQNTRTNHSRLTCWLTHLTSILPSSYVIRCRDDNIVISHKPMWCIVHSHLYGLALIYFNNMKVEAVDAFARGQKYRVQCEIVSYVDKNLQRGKKYIFQRHQSMKLSKNTDIQKKKP